jgi:hypothetical protein
VNLYSGYTRQFKSKEEDIYLISRSESNGISFDRRARAGAVATGASDMLAFSSITFHATVLVNNA